MIAAAWVCLLSPLVGALVITLGGTRIPRRVTGWIATTSTVVAFAGAVVALAKLLSEDASQRHHLSTAYTWLGAGPYHFGLTILVDPLSVFMMLIVSGVGSLIVAYSIGYMDGDAEERRYFAYMAIFVFSMLLLVQAGNLLILLVGWGLVGLSSYLLIGFNQERPSAIAAAKKAFIMNAIGDATIALALFLLIEQTGSVNFGALSAIGGSSDTVIYLVALGLLGGAVAKSAQVPLHTWLPDAMEGPTPVSALIHAATMVTAGVYLVARAHAVFELAPRALDLVAVLGTITLVMAGLIALVQTDIKRVIAYSTMSQIGYMFLGAGLGAYANSMFHLMTHAFFKALLFLGAGIVIHALTGEQDMRRMGGLRRYLPRTYWAFLIGALALTGIPPLSGFFSKDAILASALAAGTYGQILFVAGVIGAFLTGLYTFRMLFIVFGGEQSAYVQEHPPHAHGDAVAQWSMYLSVGALTVLAAVGGWIQFADVWTGIGNWLDPVARPLAEASGTQEAVASIAAVALGIAGIAVAWWIYSAHRAKAPRSWALFERKFWFDELYAGLFYWPAVAFSKLLYWVVEGPLVSGAIRGVTSLARWAGSETRDLQTGLVRMYVLALGAGVAVLIVVFVAVR
ncbi:MAG: NADH-quinone oxidoreductase subunit L [Gaiellaceae bacterium]